MASPYSATPQIIEGKYIDQRKLMRLLKNIYDTSEEGENNFRVEVRTPFFAQRCRPCQC